MSDKDVLEMLTQYMSTNTQILEMLSGAKDKERGIHTKTPATTTTAQRLHGDSGVWVGPGLDRDVLTAHVRPEGLSSLLPMLPSSDENPIFGSLTGYTAPTGSQPANACDDAPSAFAKGCNLTARFGQLRFDTNTVEMHKVMLKVNRGDYTDLVLRGRVLGLTNLEPSGLNEAQILDIMTMNEMVTVGVLFERELTRQLWQGSFAIAGEFPGLDVQIATGQKDAHTSQLCPALDSDVKNFNYQLIDNTLVNYLSMLEWYLKHNARKMGLDPVQHVVVMRSDLWFELTAMWPCAYNTTKCSPNVDTNSSVFIDGRENTVERDAMRNGMYLDINGRRYPVVIDDGIFEHNNINNGNCAAGEYASTIYMVPLTVVGNFPATYIQHVDYKGAATDTALLRGLESFFWTDNGSYAWALEQIKFCYKMAGLTERRVILRTPQLAGRIDAVKYSPLQHLRDYDPDSPYFVDGGVSIRPGIGAPNAVWN
jgi:hypothetical protein